MTPRSTSPGALTVAEAPAVLPTDPLGALLDVGALLDEAEEATPSGELTQLLLFRLEDEWYAAPLDRVREVLKECPVSPLPCVPDFVLGVMNVRGEVLSVTDLGRLMHVGGIETACSKLPAVVLENAECATALPVSELGEIVELALGDVEPPIAGADRSRTTYLAGTIEVGKTMAGLIDADRVLAPVGESPRS